MNRRRQQPGLHVKQKILHSQSCLRHLASSCACEVSHPCEASTFATQHLLGSGKPTGCQWARQRQLEARGAGIILWGLLCGRGWPALPSSHLAEMAHCPRRPPCDPAWDVAVVEFTSGHRGPATGEAGPEALMGALRCCLVARQRQKAGREHSLEQGHGVTIS